MDSTSCHTIVQSCIYPEFPFDVKQFILTRDINQKMTAEAYHNPYI